jgi:putative ABC transport system permease protein
MNTLRSLFLRLRNLFRNEQLDQELHDELTSHLEMHIADNLRVGMSPSEAHRQALLKLGGLEQTKESVRDRHGFPWLDTWLQDLRYVLRTLATKPAFAMIAILTLALGIGASTAVFSVVDRVLIRSLPYPQDERLVSFGVKAPFENLEFMLAPEYAVLRSQAGPFDSMTSLTPGGADCDITEQNPVRMNCAVVESNFLSTFGIHPVIGRDFTRADDLPKAPRVALLSYGLWRSRFAGDAKVVGRVMSLDQKPVEIIGVLPANFEMPTLESADLLFPQSLDESALDRNHPQILLRAFARLKPTATIQQAAAALQPWFQDSLRFVPPQFRAEVSLRVRSLRDRQIEDSRVAAWVLFGAVIAVLLLACTNVANLLLVRSTSRQRELAVRAALGASRARLARQALTESLLLALLGGIAGCALAFLLLRLFISIAPEGIVRLQQATLDFRVLTFAVAIMLFSGILSGVAPAVSKPAPDTLTGKTPGTVTRGLFRHALVAGQIAGSVILLTGASLLLFSLWKLQNVHLGLEAQHVVTAQISLAEHRYPDMSRQLSFFREVETRLGGLPGAGLVAVSDTLPPSGGMQATFFASIEIPGRPQPAQGTGGMVGYRMVTPNYFPALGIRIVRGRSFVEDDRSSAQNPVILSERLAAKLFHQGDPIGQSMRFSSFAGQGPWRTIIGIAADVRNDGLIADSNPEFYFPWKADPESYVRRAFVTFRTPLNPATLVPIVRAEIAGLDPTVPVEFATMNARVARLTQRPRFDAILLSLFAGIGVVLAALGIYGVVSFFVSQRTQEIGVRMALGATPQSILRMILLNVARWTAAGAVVGILGSWLCARLLQSLLFGVGAHDPKLLALSLLILLAVASFAAWLPARRATHVDPMVALRYE